MVFFPAVFWLATFIQGSIWWMENLASYLGLFLVTYLVFAFFFAIHQWFAHSAICIALASAFAVSSPRLKQSPEITCTNPINIVQYTLNSHENYQVNTFIHYLKTQPADLVIVQEVSPYNKGQLKTLSYLYPHFYDGHLSTDHRLDQVILSLHPLENMSVFLTQDEQPIVQGIWQIDEHRQMRLIVANPVFPSTQAQWHKRNAILLTIESMVNHFSDDEVLIIGDFNLSSNSIRFDNLLPEFQTFPVASWPTWSDTLHTPELLMVALDHLWLKSPPEGQKICQRQGLIAASGSDHILVKTQLGYANNQDNHK